jgi:hypothetical protein
VSCDFFPPDFGGRPLRLTFFFSGAEAFTAGARIAARTAQDAAAFDGDWCALNPKCPDPFWRLRAEQQVSWVAGGKVRALKLDSGLQVLDG